MAAKFTLFKDKAGKYRFNLKAANGEIIAASESYPDRKSAEKGIASVIKSAAVAKTADETGDEAPAAKSAAKKPVAKAKAPAKPKAPAKKKV